MVKLMKKNLLIFCIVYALFLSLSFVSSSNDNVVDEADILSDATETQLQNMANQIIDEHKMEPVIVTTNDSGGKSWMVYADDYFDYNGYGVGDQNEGILLLIDMGKDDGDRGYWISTTGSRTINGYQSQIEKMKSNVVKHLKAGDYDQAAIEFITMVDNMERSGQPFTYGQRVMKMVTSFIPYVVALVIGLLATGILTFQSKSKVTAGGRNYEEPGSFVLSKEVDRFEHEHTTRRAIPKSNSSGGGGGSHTGSSGTSHGGGGGGF